MKRFSILFALIAAAAVASAAASQQDDVRACDSGWAHQDWKRAVIHCHDAQVEYWAASRPHLAAFYEGREAYAYRQLDRDVDANQALEQARSRASGANDAGLVQTLNDPNFFHQNPATLLTTP